MTYTDEELRKATEALYPYGPNKAYDTRHVRAARAVLAAVLPDHDRQLLEAVADDLDRTRYSHGEPALLGMVVARDAIRERAAALAAPVEQETPSE